MEIDLYQRGVVWAFSFYMPNGTRKRLSTGLDSRSVSQEVALAEAKRIARHHLGGAFAEEKQSGKLVPTLSAALQKHWESSWSKMKSACTLKYVVPALQLETICYLPVTEVSTKKLREQIAKWQKEDELQNATINRKLTCISTVLKIAEEDGEIPACPTIPYLPENNWKERYVTKEEEAQATAFMQRLTLDTEVEERPKWELMGAAYIVLVDTGMRLGELIGVTDFNLRRFGGPELVGVWLKHGSTKNGKGRVIPLTPRAAVALERWMALRADIGAPQPSKVVAIGDTLVRLPGQINLNQNWLIRRWQTVRKAIPSLADVNLHILRHTCASRLVEGGLGIYEVSQWLGHTDLKSTLRYAHLSPGRLSLGLKALDTWSSQQEVPLGISRSHIADTPVT